MKSKAILYICEFVKVKENSTNDSITQKARNNFGCRRDQPDGRKLYLLHSLFYVRWLRCMQPQLLSFYCALELRKAETGQLGARALGRHISRQYAQKCNKRFWSMHCLWMCTGMKALHFKWKIAHDRRSIQSATALPLISGLWSGYDELDENRLLWEEVCDLLGAWRWYYWYWERNGFKNYEWCIKWIFAFYYFILMLANKEDGLSTKP